MKAFAAVILLSLNLLAQSSRVPTVTRTVQLFGDLERKLAVSSATEKAQVLTDDFEERLCSEPGTPVARQAWLQNAASSRYEFSQEAVHSYGDLALYSALHRQPRLVEMIVDAWRRSADGWKLAVRYRCPSTGTKPAESTLPKRY